VLNDVEINTYGANQIVCVTQNNVLPKIMPLCKVTKVRRAAEVILLGDSTQSGGGTYASAGWLDNSGYPGAPFLNGAVADNNGAANPATADQPLDNLPSWFPDTDLPPYKLRYRHNGKSRLVNVAFVDGHAASFPNKALRQRNLARNY
jgi:prepilin-type processing-associated H-X9-DG protein